MQRRALDTPQIHPAIQTSWSSFHADIVDQVATAVAREPVVVVGMATNPFVKKARKALEAAGVPFTYQEYGGYLSQWKQRLAIKMWSGWPTFPQVFVQGRLVGGFNDLKKLIDAGELAGLIAAGR